MTGTSSSRPRAVLQNANRRIRRPAFFSLISIVAATVMWVLLGCQSALAQVPTITVQPQSVTESATYGTAFTVTAAGGLPLIYQWRFAATNLTGATNATLTLSNLNGSDAGSYTVVVSNASGSVTSLPALLTVAPPLSVFTLAGAPGLSGSLDGFGEFARFLSPSGVTVDASSNVDVADSGNNTIRQITPAGVVSTLAGQAGIGGLADGVGRSARFSNPGAMAADTNGNVYVADYRNNAIRKIAPGAKVTTLAAGLPGGPTGLAIDANGNGYVTLNDQTVRMVTPGGVVSLLAGSFEVAGSTDGAGASARFNTPNAIAVDSVGNLYVADDNNNAIRKIALVGANWVVSTVAGQASLAGYADGVGTNALLTNPLGVTVDGNGNIYVAEAGGDIREITPGGVVRMVAGLPATSGGYDGTGSAASFYGPSGLAVDSAGNVYVADTYNNAIRKAVFGPAIITQPQSQTVGVGSNAVFSVVASGATPLSYQWFFNAGPIVGATNSTLVLSNAHNAAAGSYTVLITNPGAAIASSVAILNVSYPLGTTVDPRITAAPQTDSVAVGGEAQFSVAVTGTPPFAYQWLYNGAILGGATSATLTLNDVSAGQAGNYAVVVSNAAGSVTSAPAPLIVSVPLSVITVAGLAGFTGASDGAGPYARFYNPSAVAVDALGNVYVADESNDTIRQITPAGVVSTLAGLAGVAGYADDVGSAARFAGPVGIAVDSAENLYVADSGNGAVRKILPGGAVSTLAGGFNDPAGVAVDAFGNVYASAADNTIRQITPTGGVSILAGLFGISGSADGVGVYARFNHPAGLAVDTAGNVYVADQDNSAIRKITSSGTNWVVSTLAGQAGNPGFADGIASTAQFGQGPLGVAVDSSGNVYVADSANDTIRLVTPTGVVATVAGLAFNAGPYDGTGNAAWFNGPAGIAVDFNGNVYVADQGNDTIRKGVIGPGIISQPQSQTVNVGSNAMFSVTATGATPLSYQWFFNGAGLPGAANPSLSISNAHHANAGSYTVVVSNAGSSVTSLVATLTVVYPAGVPIDPALAVPPQSQIATAGTDVLLTTLATGTPPFTYQWLFNGASIPLATNSFLYLPGALGGAAGSYQVVVSNAGGSITSPPATLTISVPLTITTFAGLAGSPGTNDGAGANARFNLPVAVAVDAAANVYVSDQGNSLIRKITPGGSVSTVAGLAGQPGTNDGPVSSARFDGPEGIALDTVGNIYVADSASGAIRKITGGMVTTLAAGFGVPKGLAVDSHGNLFVADGLLYTINTIAPGGTTSLLAGLPGSYGSADGIGPGARFSTLTGVAWDGTENLYAADQNNGTIRRITIDGLVTTIAGLASAGGTNDGVGSAARFSKPEGLAVNANGNLFVGDPGNGNIRQIVPVGSNWLVTTVAGAAGNFGSADGVGAAASFGYAGSDSLGVAADASGNVYIADAANNTIRKGGFFPSIIATPSSQLLAAGANLTLNAAVTGTLPLGYQWLLNGSNIAGATNATLTLVSVQGANAGSYTLIVSNAYGAATSTITALAVMAPPALAAPPQSDTAVSGQSVVFVASATGGGTLVYQWQFNGGNLLGASASILALTNVSVAQAGAYTVIITNLVGSVTSAPAFLTVVTNGTAVTSTPIVGTWTAANSPYVIGMNVTVSNLVIQPGVTVLFNGPFSLTVTGTLQAVGAAANPIIFTGGSAGLAWQGIRFVSANTNGAMSWCVVRGATAGGIRFTNTPFAMDDCVIDSNSGPSGGGIYTDSPLRLQNCALINNWADYGQQGGAYFVQGGGLYLAGGDAALACCIVSNNRAVMPDIGSITETSTGGGIDAEAGTLTLTNCLIVNNTAAGAGLSATELGGGIYLNNVSALLLAAGCVFQANRASNGFGGAAAVGNAALANCVFSTNQATFGGALYVGGAGQTMASNCLLAANSASAGGAVYSTAGTAVGDFENCTLTHNSPDAFNGYTGLIHDSILYFDGSEIVPGPLTNPVVNFCDVQGGYNGPGTNNVSLDPQFANATNYLLGASSPLIDAGDPNPSFNDQAFPPSQGGDTNDLGAYGGPGAANWPAFAAQSPVVLVNGQAAAPLQVLTFPNTAPPSVSFSNGFPGGSFEYTLDGSNPLNNPTLTQSQFLLTHSARLRLIAYSPDYSSLAIAAPVTINVLPAYTVTADSAGGGGVTPPGGVFYSNTAVILTATNAAGWTFLRWAGNASGTNNPLPVVVNNSLNIQAVFGTPLTVSVTGSGAVQSNPALALYPYGSVVQLMGIPSAANIYFRLWGGAALGNSVSPLDFVITNPAPSVTALFGGLPNGSVALNLLVNGSGEVSRTPQADSYSAGSVVSLGAMPSQGSVFTGWSGGASATNNPLNVTLNSSLTITANFRSTNAPPPSPPLVAITSPLSGAQFIAPAGISVTATSSDPNANGAITQVAFFAGLNFLAVLTNGPFTFLWTNPPVGTNVLTAIASDSFGLSTKSAAVTVTVNLPPPGPPVFTLSSSVYSVLENGGSVIVTVQKSVNSLGGVVNFGTANGSAVAVVQGVGNYQAVAGSLVFAAGDTAQTVAIPIVFNQVYEGNTTFNFLLSLSGDGSSVGAPGSAAITIVDVNQPSTTNSLLANIFPSPPPPSSGRLSVITQPAAAQGQWRLLWEGTWHNSGDVISGLPTGNYPTEFSPVAGFTQPADTTNAVTSGSLTLVTNQYVLSGQVNYGSLSVTILPASVANAGNVNLQGLWQLQGDTGWHNSGEVTNNLVAGDHIVLFKPVIGWVTPAPLIAYVGANQANLIAATYLLAEQLSATAPSVLQFSDATTAEFGLPYVYNGQLQTDAGYGSGCVVQPRVVLTAGHLVFNDGTLTFVQNANWFFQEYAGTYAPPAQTAAGWYILSGYAAARTNDNSPGVESPASQNLDAAALYFLQNAGRGGSSGYLVSDPNGTEWLQASALKTLVGYPVEDVDQIEVGRMHSTTPGNLGFTLVTNNVFSTTAISGYPGDSGGPLCVLYTNGIYYPAGVYLGGSDNTIVRAIDSQVAQLINAASVSGNTGATHSGNVGPILGSPGSNPFQQGNYQIVLAPAAAVSSGAGWEILGVNTNFTDSAAIYALPAGTYTLAFAPVAGFATPSNQTLTVTANQTATLTVTYAANRPLASFSAATLAGGILKLTLAAAPGERFALERSTNLLNWTALTTNTANTNGLANFTDNTVTNQAKAAFYRARFVP